MDLEAKASFTCAATAFTVAGTHSSLTPSLPSSISSHLSSMTVSVEPVKYVFPAAPTRATVAMRKAVGNALSAAQADCSGNKKGVSHSARRVGERGPGAGAARSAGFRQNVMASRSQISGRQQREFACLLKQVAHLPLLAQDARAEIARAANGLCCDLDLGSLLQQQNEFSSLE